MKRRRFFQALTALPAVPAILAQQPAASPPVTDNYPRLETGNSEAVGEAVLQFFNAQQFAALRRLSDLLVPRLGEAPGALDAQAPEFLDFLIGQSGAERQLLYRTGLDLLNAQSRRRFNRPFAEIEASQAELLLAPLRTAWTYDPPADPLARFLQAVKQDVRAATVNSREWNTGPSAAGRRGGGIGLYWNPVD